jgi:hypothetical protein
MKDESSRTDESPDEREGGGNHVRGAVVAVLVLFVAGAILLMVVDALLFP